MPSRREFLRVGLAASVAPLAMPTTVVRPETSWRADTVMEDMYSIYRVVSDVRFAAGTAFAREADRLGTSVVSIRGDITDFWFHDLSIRWRTEPLAVAGLTAHGPLFCLERLAWDHGMRVVFRGSHRTVGDGGVEHVLSAPPATIAHARATGLEGPRWAPRLAHLVTACASTGGSEALTVAPHRAGVRGGRDEPEDTLVSWVIAPHNRV